MDIETVRRLYREYVNASQAELIGSFGFGRTTVLRAEGMYLYTADGGRVLDFTGGVGVLNHGHNHPRLLEARMEFQRQRYMEVHKNFLSQYVAALSHNIAQLLPEDLNVSYFCNSGAEAVEGAVKLAYKYFGGRRKTILRSDIGFHGKLLGAGGLTASPEVSFSFPTISNIETFVYDDIESVRAAIDRSRRADGESDAYALLLEPMSASSLRECSTEFLRSLRDLCTREGIVLIFDEVYTGWAKAGPLFYFMKHGVTPDILTMSKSFGGGKSSISGYTARAPLFRGAYDNLNDAVLHSTTYNAFGEECITAMEAIRIAVEEDYPAKAEKIYQRLNRGLRELQAKYPFWITDVRGSGALNGLILNSGLGGAEVLIRHLPGAIFKDEYFAAKLVVSSVVAELYDTHRVLTFFGCNHGIPLILSPSLIATEQEIDFVLSALDKTMALGKAALLMKFIKNKLLPSRT